MKFSIRTATAEDFDGVDALLGASYRALLARDYDERAVALMSRANPTLLASGTYYVAVADDGPILGCGGWTPQRPGTSISEPGPSTLLRTGLAHLRHFGTHPDWIRRGIGRAIYARCEVDARATGIERLECYSTMNGEPFYTSLGFKRIAVLDIAMSATVTAPAVAMTKQL